MRINNNIAAMNTQSRLASAQGAQAKSLEKLSSGLRINKAGDDAAGLAISEKMRGQINGLNQATRNAQDGISLIQTAEGGLNETHSILQRMRELAVQSSNDTNTGDDRLNIQDEMDQLAQEITRIADTTKFNNKPLMASDTAKFTGQLMIGANSGETLDVEINSMNSQDLLVGLAASGASSVVETATVAGSSTFATDVNSYTQKSNLDIKIEMITAGAAGTKGIANVTINGQTVEVTADDATASSTFTLDASKFDTFEAGQQITITAATNVGGDEVNIKVAGATTSITGLDVSDSDKAQAAVDTIDDAIKTVSTERSKLGSIQNRLDHTINNLTTTSENLTAAESRIRDVDMAKEMMNFTKNNILNQASTAMLAQANQMPQGVLQLLG